MIQASSFGTLVHQITAVFLLFVLLGGRVGAQSVGDRANPPSVSATTSGVAIGTIASKNVEVKTYQITNFYQVPSTKLDRVKSLARQIKAIETLLDAGYISQASQQIDAAFSIALGDPDIVTTHAGLLIITNLHILKARAFEASGQVKEASLEYIKPQALLNGDKRLRQDYLAKITERQALLSTPQGLSVFIEFRCGYSYLEKCFDLAVTRARQNFRAGAPCAPSGDCSHSYAQYILDFTAPNKLNYSSWNVYSPYFESRYKIYLTYLASLLKYGGSAGRDTAASVDRKFTEELKETLLLYQDENHNVPPGLKLDIAYIFGNRAIISIRTGDHNSGAQYKKAASYMNQLLAGGDLDTIPDAAPQLKKIQDRLSTCGLTDNFRQTLCGLELGEPYRGNLSPMIDPLD
ncbi:hypothetical protein QCE63_28000 [Caballeronia sp. LZ065]|uniref:hypothetical protein n=1 Tax=Caballeronia sp. LZ065 TaxID=3038571 RepID=UPI0028673A0A|nr:hypothetical protein [Caballeronia sp. LZ065]MDR5783257.1 hypothetical protein [Caballeronia sp. LZ065]